jgi:hypothetical protein
MKMVVVEGRRSAFVECVQGAAYHDMRYSAMLILFCEGHHGTTHLAPPVVSRARHLMQTVRRRWYISPTADSTRSEQERGGERPNGR